MGDEIYVLEYLDERDNWRLRKEGGGHLPIEGRDRDDVLDRARKWVGEHAPARLRIEDENGLTEEELSFR